MAQWLGAGVKSASIMGTQEGPRDEWAALSWAGPWRSEVRRGQQGPAVEQPVLSHSSSAQPAPGPLCGPSGSDQIRCEDPGGKFPLRSADMTWEGMGGYLRKESERLWGVRLGWDGVISSLLVSGP